MENNDFQDNNIGENYVRDLIINSIGWIVLYVVLFCIGFFSVYLILNSDSNRYLNNDSTDIRVASIEENNVKNLF